MDLVRALADHQIATKMKERQEAEFRIILICPANDVLPDDGFLTYNKAVDIKALLAAPDGSVLVFDEHNSRLMKMLVEFQDEFGCRVKVLEGVPHAEYSPWFNSVSWSQDKVSYAGLLSEMSIATSMEEASGGERSVYDKERKQYTNASGDVKVQDNFRVAGENDSIGEEDE